MRLIIMAALSFMLLACQSTPTKPSKQLPHVIPVQSWQMTAKMYLNNGVDSGSGKLRWKEYLDWVTARFDAPLGQGSWVLDERALTFTNQQGDQWRATDVDTLLSEQLQLNIPWHDIKSWIKGHWPVEAIWSDADTQVQFQKDGWSVTAKKFKPVQGVLLAHRFDIRKGSQVVKMSVKSWQW